MVSRHSSVTMMASAETTAIRLEAMFTSVLVTACCAPTTSLLSRAMSSPVLLSVKNRNDRRCRWPYTAHRRSKMIPSPIREPRYR